MKSNRGVYGFGGFAGKGCVEIADSYVVILLLEIKEAIDTFNRWLDFYNYERIHSGINYLSPYNYLLSMGIDLVKEMELKKALAPEPPLEDLNRNTVQYLGG